MGRSQTAEDFSDDFSDGHETVEIPKWSTDDAAAEWMKRFADPAPPATSSRRRS